MRCEIAIFNQTQTVLPHHGALRATSQARLGGVATANPTRRRYSKRNPAPPPPPPPAPPRWWRRSKARWTLFALLVVAGLLLNLMLFVSPRSDEPTAQDDIDAVIALSGEGGRLDRAIQLMQADVAPVLVISAGTKRPDPESAGLCAGDASYEVLCPDPTPWKTRGEAKAISELINERGWTKVALVTSNYHLTRARVLFRHCSDVEIVPVAATHPPYEVADWWDTLVHEWGGLAQALLLRRQCG